VCKGQVLGRLTTFSLSATDELMGATAARLDRVTMGSEAGAVDRPSEGDLVCVEAGLALFSGGHVERLGAAARVLGYHAVRRSGDSVAVHDDGDEGVAAAPDPATKQARVALKSLALTGMGLVAETLLGPARREQQKPGRGLDLFCYFNEQTKRGTCPQAISQNAVCKHGYAVYAMSLTRSGDLLPQSDTRPQLVVRRLWAYVRGLLPSLPVGAGAWFTEPISDSTANWPVSLPPTLAQSQARVLGDPGPGPATLAKLSLAISVGGMSGSNPLRRVATRRKPWKLKWADAVARGALISNNSKRHKSEKS
jgi:hypothetical protein